MIVEAGLIERVAAGDEKALEALYLAVEKPVYRFVRSKLNDPFEAADIVNEVMLEVWRRAGSFEGRSSVASWIFGIAYHKAVDRLRRRRDTTGGIDEEVPDDSIEDPVERLSGQADARRLRECLETLSAHHRLVVHLVFYEDLSYPEVARIAGCPEGTVKTRMFHAKRLLQHCLSRGPLDRTMGAGR